MCTFAAEHPGGEQHPLRRPAAPAPGPTAWQEPGHSPHRVCQPQGSCQVTPGTAACTARPCQGGRRDVSAGHHKEEVELFARRALISARHAMLTMFASQGSSPRTWKLSRPQDETTRPSTSALCKLFRADNTRRMSHTPVSTSMGLLRPFLSPQVHNLCYLFTSPIKASNSLLSSPAVLGARAVVPVGSWGSVCYLCATAKPPAQLPAPTCPRQRTCPIPQNLHLLARQQEALRNSPWCCCSRLGPSPHPPSPALLKGLS